MKAEDISTTDRPDVQASAKRAYIGKRKKKRTLKLQRRQPAPPRPGRMGGYR